MGKLPVDLNGETVAAGHAFTRDEVRLADGNVAPDVHAEDGIHDKRVGRDCQRGILVENYGACLDVGVLNGFPTGKIF